MTLLPWEYFWIGFNKINFPDLFNQVWVGSGVLLIILIVLPLFVGNAVRAAGWMTVFGNKGFLNATCIATATTWTCGSGSSGAG